MKNKRLLCIFYSWQQVFSKNIDYLTQLDSVGGDADLGIVMQDGFQAINEFVMKSDLEDVGMLFYQVGKKFNNVASSSMGTLIAAGFMNIGKQLKGKTNLENNEIYQIVISMAEGVKQLGKAEEGEKTFLDAIYPAARAMKENITCTSLIMVDMGLKAAKNGVDNATNMVARHGRLAFRGAMSQGIIDPGSVVAKLFIEGIYKALRNESK